MHLFLLLMPHLLSKWQQNKTEFENASILICDRLRPVVFLKNTRARTENRLFDLLRFKLSYILVFLTLVL